jgi:hypothetical protein
MFYRIKACYLQHNQTDYLLDKVSDSYSDDLKNQSQRQGIFN